MLYLRKIITSCCVKLVLEESRGAGAGAAADLCSLLVFRALLVDRKCGRRHGWEVSVVFICLSSFTPR